MSDARDLGWMLKVEKEAKRSEVAAESRRLQDSLTDSAIRAGSEVFWRQLLQELRGVVDGFPRLRMNGSVSAQLAQGAEWHCRIEARSESLRPKSLYYDLFYRPGGEIIRVSSSNGDLLSLSFCISEGKVCLRVPARSHPANPAQAAEYLGRRMIEAVKPD
jgi:hypothetical protein